MNPKFPAYTLPFLPPAAQASQLGEIETQLAAAQRSADNALASAKGLQRKVDQEAAAAAEAGRELQELRKQLAARAQVSSFWEGRGA